MKVIFCMLVLGVAATFGFPRSFRQPPERIVGGVPAIRGNFPWMVQIKQGVSHYCGGSIINQNWIVTAAHCAQGNLIQYSVVAGELVLNSNEGTEQTRGVTRIIEHPDYNSWTLDSDIALMRLDSPLSLNLYVRPVTLPSAQFEVAGDLVVAGWGALTEGGQSPDRLMKVTVPFVPREECEENYGAGEITEGMICAGEGGKDSCQGDSGGPMHQGETLVGIVSWGIGCARPGYPGVYANVPHYVNWILANSP